MKEMRCAQGGIHGGTEDSVFREYVVDGMVEIRMRRQTTRRKRTRKAVTPPRGRPHLYDEPRRVTILVDASDAEALRLFAAWRRTRERVPISQGGALIAALKESRLYKIWLRETDGR